ncbi:MAG: hypothetical protein ABGY72_12805, partial [bacterium]
DGSIYRQTPEIYATEGPIYDIDVANQEVHVMGKVLKIPVVVNYGGFAGTTMNISGSGIRGNDSEARSEMDAENIDRMLDTNAVFRDAAGGLNGMPDQTGAIRSVFSSDTSLAKDSVADAKINANYRNIVKACYSRHAAFLPANFLERALGADGLREPPYYGGTFKTAGHRYTLENGTCPNGATCRPTVLIPDIEVVLELAENVTEGTVTSAFGEDLVLGCPPSLTIDDQMLVMNPDPRFGRDILGIVGQEISGDLFTSLDGAMIAAIGHMRGEHVNFMQEVLTDLIDPNDVVHIVTDRGQITETNTADGTFGGDILSVRAIGAIDKPQHIFGFTGPDAAGIVGNGGLTATLGTIDAQSGKYVSLSLAPRPLSVIQTVGGREGTFTLRGRQDMEVVAGQGVFVSHMQVCGLVNDTAGLDGTDLAASRGTVVCSEPGDLENSTAAAFEVLADEAAVIAAGNAPPFVGTVGDAAATPEPDAAIAAGAFDIALVPVGTGDPLAPPNAEFTGTPADVANLPTGA